MKIQINLGNHVALEPGYIAYPIATNVVKCPRCGRDNNVLSIRLQAEAQSGKKAVQ